MYQVGDKSFVFFRNHRADATDPETGERYADVIVFWVGSESDKQALVQDRASPFQLVDQAVNVLEQHPPVAPDAASAFRRLSRPHPRR